MNLVQLKYFHAVCTFGTVSAAAEYLFISQPSLSSAIKELESEFGVALFKRQHRGMTLTPQGELLFKMSGELLGRADEIKNIMNDIGKERKLLRLGIPPMIGSLILPDIYRSFPAQHPEIRLEITEGGRRELLERLSGDMLDMAILPHAVSDIGKEFASLKISELETVLCVSKDSELSSLEKVCAKELEGVPLVLFKNSFFQTEEIKKWFTKSGVSPDILLQTEQLSTVLSIVSSGIAKGFLFRQLIYGNRDFVAIPTEIPMYVNVSLVWKKDAYFFSCMKKFRDFIENNNPIIKEGENK